MHQENSPFDLIDNLFENIPEFVQRVFNYNFNRTIIPWMLLYTKGDKSILKSEELVSII